MDGCDFARRFCMETQAEMRLRIGVADKEPAIDQFLFSQCRHYLAQRACDQCLVLRWCGIKLEIGPILTREALALSRGEKHPLAWFLPLPGRGCFVRLH